MHTNPAAPPGGRSSIRPHIRYRRYDGGDPVRLVAAASVALAALWWAAPTFAQDPPAVQTTADKFKAARDLIADGKLELAADKLKAFLADNPTDKDFLDLEARFGPTVFQRLLRVVQWSENKDADVAAKAAVDAIIKRANDATRKVAQNPERIRKYVANLGKSAAERDFAVDQLIPAGEAAVPEVVSALRSTTESAVKAGILSALPKLPASTVPVFIAALDPACGLPDDVKAAVLKAVTSRADIAQLLDKAETNPTPVLWLYATSPTPQLKETAVGILETLTGGLSGRRAADAELVRLAEPFVTRKGAFATLDQQTGLVKVWLWDANTNGLKALALDKAVAEEFYALKYLKWAVTANPKSEAAQLAFLAVAAEREVERSGFGDLRLSSPNIYGLLAAAPDATLSALLEQGLTENRTSLAVGILQAMSDRGQKDESGGKGGQSPYARALSYPDARVQFAAAVALLRGPGTPAAGTSARVVEVLRRALDGKADAGDEAKAGRVLIADPVSNRADRLATHFRELGYATEKFTSGRELLKRVAKASDFDLIALDRHLADPLLNDVLGHLAADPNAARRPVLLVASGDKPKAPPLEALLLRLAVLVAATETAAREVPPPYAYDPKFPPTQKPKQTFEQAVETARWQRTDERNVALLFNAADRLKRLQRLVDAADLPTSKVLDDRLQARLPQLTYGVLAIEYGITAPNPPRPSKSALDPDAIAQESADAALAAAKKAVGEDVVRNAPPPDPFVTLADYTDLIRSQERLNESIAKITDTNKLGQLIEQIESQLDAESKKRIEAMLPRISPAALLIDTAEYRDRDLEARLARQVRGLKGVAVLPEPFGPNALADDLRQVVADPALRTRSDAEKQATAKAAATWLGQIAAGAVPGYSISDSAQESMRTALRSDDLAPELIDGLAKLGSGDTQVALVQLAANANRPLPIRTQAADAAARHVQAFGKHTPADAAQVIRHALESEKDFVLRGKLVVLDRLVAAKATDLGAAISGFAPRLRVPDPAPPPKDPKDPPKDPKDPPKDPKPPEAEKK